MPSPLPLALSSRSGATATNAAGEDTAITIYSSAEPGAISPDLYRPVPGGGVPNASSVPGYAMVRQERDVKLASGRSTLKFADVAALIDPTTVTFTSLTEPRTRVLEQSYQFDLVSTDKLLLKYIDRPIAVERHRWRSRRDRQRNSALSHRRVAAANERRDDSIVARLLVDSIP